MGAIDQSGQGYILATGERGADRLQLLNELFGPGTQELLRVAGLRPAMRVAEIGCGTGLVSQWIAQVVGTGGSVTATDLSDEQLGIAERNAAAVGLKNISFQRTSAYKTTLPKKSFDLVYSRFLFCHLTEPLRALKEMRSLLRPGAILVCEDHDDGGIFTEPPTRAYKRLVEISEAVNRAHGLDSYIGLKLPGLMRQAGFSNLEVRANQLALLRGRGKSFWEVTLREAAAAILAAGASTSEELESIYSEMQAIANDDSILLMPARVTQVWARR